MISFRRTLAFALLWLGSCAANVPANLHVSVTKEAVSFDANGVVLSTAVLCPGFAFDQFGAYGPKLSPDDHWALVDVQGPFTPGNVPRTEALVRVVTGEIVFAPNFPIYLGVPATLVPISWASGQRATLVYPNGKSATIADPPLRSIPAPQCIRGNDLRAIAPTASPAPSATPYQF